MIVVRVELHSAVTGEITEIGTAIISNDGTGTNDRGNYDVKVARKQSAGNLRYMFHYPRRTGRVENYPRLKYCVWRLVIRALRSAFPEETMDMRNAKSKR